MLAENMGSFRILPPSPREWQLRNRIWRSATCQSFPHFSNSPRVVAPRCDESAREGTKELAGRKKVRTAIGALYNSAMLRLTISTLVAFGNAYGAGCDRSCLKAALDQYLNAVVQHNPSAAPLSVGFRQTENASVRRPGTGLWQSAKALGTLQRPYFDAESGQAGYFGTLDEENGPAIVTLRLKVEEHKITEAEWVLSR